MSDSAEIAVVIPCRQGRDSPVVALESLARQTFTDFVTVVVWDRGRGASWARNRGVESTRSRLLLFSDNDVRWRPDAVERLRSALANAPERIGFAYGDYVLNGALRCPGEFDADRLRRENYIPTMALVRREAFPGFDETLDRLQDWDLWLTMLERGATGRYRPGGVLWESWLVREGISGDVGGLRRWIEAVRRKHGLERCANNATV